MQAMEGMPRMATAAAYPMNATEPDVQVIASGSHVVELGERRALVRDVELFATFDEEHPDMGTVDADRLRRIADRTNALIAAGRYPQLVVIHRSPLTGATDPQASPESVGRVRGPVRVGTSAINGRVCIFGDLELERWDLDLLRRYPRRSAEAAKGSDGEYRIAQIALLGRDEPRADIPDVLLFHRDETPVAVESQTPELRMEAMPMTTPNALNAARAAFSALTPEQQRAMAAEFAAPAPSPVPTPAPAPTPDPAPAPTVAHNANPDVLATIVQNAVTAATAPLTARIDSMNTDLLTVRAQAGQIAEDRRREKYRHTLQMMAVSEGVHFGDMDADVARLTSMTEDAATAELERIRANYRRDTTAASLVHNSGAPIAQNAATGAPGAPSFNSANADEFSRLVGNLTTRGLDHNEAVARAARTLGCAVQFGISPNGPDASAPIG